MVHELAGKTKQLLFALLDKNPVLLEKLNSQSWYLGTVRGGKHSVYDGELRAMDSQGADTAGFLRFRLSADDDRAGGP